MPENMGSRRNGLAERFASMTPAAKRISVIVLCAILLFVATVSTTVAYIVINGNGSATVDEFRSPDVSCTVNYSDATVTNTSDIPVYVRVRVLINWVGTDGTIYAGDPMFNTAEQCGGKGTNWEYVPSENTFYYLLPAAPIGENGAITTSFLNNASVFNDNLSNITRPSLVPSTASPRVIYVAEAIQADGKTAPNGGNYAVQDAWGDSRITEVDPGTGKLTVSVS